MRTASPQSGPGVLFKGDLLEQINPRDAYSQLARKIPWAVLEQELQDCYSDRGRPAKNIRLMCGLLIIKQLEDLSDDQVVQEWIRNPYFQYFCGETTFQWAAPCASSDLTHFRQRIGVEGVEKIFKASVLLHKKKALEKEVLFDTTVQEKNITFPTDSKLQIKVITRLWKIVSVTGLSLRRSYKKEIKKIIRTINFCRSPKKSKEVKKAKNRLKTIASTLFREIKRKISVTDLEIYQEQFKLFERVLTQLQKDKNKIYSLHEPKTLCIAKGKKHKKYEFGSKVSIAVTKTHGVIVAAKNFDKNLYDGDTLGDTIQQMARILKHKPDLGICDRGCRGRKIVEGVQILTPENQGQKISETEKQKNRKRNKRRSAIEPVIGHLKSDFRMFRNFLKGTLGDEINALMAAAAFNFMKWMREAKLYLHLFILRLLTAFYANRTLNA